MGLSLAAVCGLRAFLPLFLISVLGALGKVELSDSFDWLATPAAISTFGVAVVVELLADKFPVVDHLLDSVGIVIKPAAAGVVMASMITAFDPLVALVLGILSGGLLAEGLHLLKAKLRLFSSLTTGTIANPFLSLLEDVSALVLTLIAWLAPIAGALAIVLFFVVVFLRRRSTNDEALRKE